MGFPELKLLRLLVAVGMVISANGPLATPSEACTLNQTFGLTSKARHWQIGTQVVGLHWHKPYSPVEQLEGKMQPWSFVCTSRGDFLIIGPHMQMQPPHLAMHPSHTLLLLPMSQKNHRGSKMSAVVMKARKLLQGQERRL